MRSGLVLSLALLSVPLLTSAASAQYSSQGRGVNIGAGMSHAGPGHSMGAGMGSHNFLPYRQGRTLRYGGANGAGFGGAAFLPNRPFLVGSVLPVGGLYGGGYYGYPLGAIGPYSGFPMGGVSPYYGVPFAGSYPFYGNPYSGAYSFYGNNGGFNPYFGGAYGLGNPYLTVPPYFYPSLLAPNYGRPYSPLAYGWR